MTVRWFRPVAEEDRPRWVATDAGWRVRGPLRARLQSANRREQFLLDLSRGRIDLCKVKIQNRGRQVVVLVRLDLDGAPHRNPDDEEIPVPHLHVYRPGYGDPWAIPVPADCFRDPGNVWTTFEDFPRYCNITRSPHINRGFFA